MLVVSVFSFSGLAGAHSGRTDSGGGHNCYVAPCAGQYHFHGGSGYNIPKTTPTMTTLIEKLPKSTLLEKHDDFDWEEVWFWTAVREVWFWTTGRGAWFWVLVMGAVLVVDIIFPRVFTVQFEVLKKRLFIPASWALGVFFLLSIFQECGY